MKILLVRPPSFKMPIIIPNLGLGYLAASLRKNHHQVSILDCAQKKFDHDQYRHYLAEEKPDIVGVQMYTCDFSSSKRCVDIAKAFNRKMITIIGGPHPSGAPALTMHMLKNADFAFAGEAEPGLPKLIQHIEFPDMEKIDFIEGLIYRHRGQIVQNKRGHIHNLDDIPFPSWDLINPRAYPDAPHGTFSKRLPIAPIITSRGCPYQCTYCGVSVNAGRIFRMRSVHNIIEEIKYLQHSFGIREFHIEDDNFTLVRPRVMEFCKKIQEEKISMDWACTNGIRLDRLDKELLLNMEKAGCYSFSVGIESGSPRILADMKRDETLETMIEKMELIHSSTKIRTTGFFMMGYPAETREDIEKTIALSLRLPLNRAQFSNFLPLPGTEIYERLVEDKKLNPESIPWDHYQNNRTVFSPEGISAKELRSLMKKAFARFYFRLPILAGLAKEIHSLNQFRTIIRRFFDIFR